MTSTISVHKQIDSNVQYLKALATTTVYTPSSNVISNLPLVTFLTITSTSTYPSGTIFRDMGKRVVTYNTSNQEVGKYIFVQPQVGSASEGVPANYDSLKFYIQVWAAATSATAVTVGRVG